jgi:hypothetical protein
MMTLHVGLAEELQHDFSRARAQLTLARLHRAKKDTPANRAAVAECLARIDAVLDMYLEARYLRL